MNATTRKIAGLTLTLIPGRRYLASRPMASRRDQRFTVRVTDITDGIGPLGDVIASGLDYDRANAIVAAFNNGPISFEGRVW